jgi:hypothetical protein
LKEWENLVTLIAGLADATPLIWLYSQVLASVPYDER